VPQTQVMHEPAETDDDMFLSFAAALHDRSTEIQKILGDRTSKGSRSVCGSVAEAREHVAFHDELALVGEMKSALAEEMADAGFPPEIYVRYIREHARDIKVKLTASAGLQGYKLLIETI
jgi:hypothetical protein